MKDLKKDIVFHQTLRNTEFAFHTTWGLFSPKKIDAGTHLLIRTMEIQETDDCLDLGCGYGAIGIVMAKYALKGTVHLVDKDYVAIEYAQKNMAINGLLNCTVLLSNGFSEIRKKKFTVIAANLPANVGKEMLTILLSDARSHLFAGGRLYLVTISGLKHFIKRNLLSIFGNYKKLKQSGSYTVSYAEKK